jgi:hypothetical protein
MKFHFVRRYGKVATLVVLAAVVLTGAARVGVSRYLASARGKALVSDRLGTALGMPVEVSELDVGNESASFRFRVMDPGDPKAEVLNVRSASADVSASDLMTGRVTPSALNFKGAALTLRVNADGQLATPLPALPGASGSFPAVVIEGGGVCIRQDGRPDFAVSGVNLRLEPAGQQVVLSGSVRDPKWGEWTIRGELRRDNRTGWVELASTDAPLDPELLATIPFAPPDLFDNVEVPGRVAVTIRLALGANRDVQPTVEIGPALKVFGTPLGQTYRLYTSGDHAYFEK